MERPNIFQFATSELSQDAFLCWLLAWADIKYESSNPKLHRLGIDFLNRIYSLAKLNPPVQFSKVEISRQDKHIDILCTVNDGTKILIEDKVGTKQHDGQLKRYREDIARTCQEIIPVYIQTGDQSDYSDVEAQEFFVFDRRNVLAVLESPAGQAASRESDILDDFKIRLRETEDEVQSYSVRPVSEWLANSWTGFYKKLQEELKQGGWGYVANASGGFLGFWWDRLGNDECERYLQLEIAMPTCKPQKFCFKIGVPDPSKRAEFRDLWCDRLITDFAKQGIRVRKPDRLGFGEAMTVALLAEEFPCRTSRGLLDLTATRDRIKTVMGVFDMIIDKDSADQVSKPGTG